MKLIFCFGFRTVEGLEHPRVSGFRFQCVRHMTRESSSAAAVRPEEQHICSLRDTLKQEQKLLWGLRQGHINMQRFFFLNKVLKSGIITANIKAVQPATRAIGSEESHLKLLAQQFVYGNRFYWNLDEHWNTAYPNSSNCQEPVLDYHSKRTTLLQNKLLHRKMIS